jgi:hypothetical protein
MRRNRELHELSEEYELDEPNPDATLARARAKYQEILERQVPLRPAGFFAGRILWHIFFLIMPGATLGLIALGLFSEALEEGQPGYYLICAPVAVLAAVCLGYGMAGIAGSKASSPKKALLLFFRLIGRGRFEASHKLVIPNDFDSFPRFFPDEPGLGLSPPTDPLFFDDFEEYKDYWRALVRFKTAPYCLVKIKNFRAELVTPDLMICDFRLMLGINTSLWFLFILFPWGGLLLAIIIDLATRRRVTRDMTKVLVRVGDEWHLFNGAWCEHDETDLSWLPEAAEE